MRCESCKILFDGKNASYTLLSILIAPRVALDFSISRDIFSPDMEKEMRSVVAAKCTPHCSCRNELKMMLIPDKYRHTFPQLSIVDITRSRLHRSPPLIIKMFH